MYYVYVIYNKKHKKIYIGQCENISIRLDQHNSKFFPNCYTARFNGNWELIHQEEYDTRIEVLKREKQLKSYRGREFLKTKYSAIAQW